MSITNTMRESYLPVALHTDSPEISIMKPSTTTPLNKEATSHSSEHGLLTNSTASTTSMQSSTKRANKWKIMKRILCALGALGVMAIASVLLLRFFKTDEFNHVIEWIQAHELIGSLIYITSFAVCIILCFPSTAFELLAGYIFGFSLGLLVASIGKLLGSIISFLIGRYLCRQQVQEYMERGSPYFKAFRSLLRKRQVMIVYLTRIAFFPIAMKNYGLSVLDVSFPIFVSAAFITGVPFSMIWVYSGHTAQHLTTLFANSKGSSKHKTEIVLLIVGAVSGLVLLFLIGFYTRKHVLALAEEESLASAQKDEENVKNEEDERREDREGDDKTLGMSVV